MNWVCPYCEHAQAVVDAKSDSGAHHIYVRDNVHGDVAIYYSAIACANKDCREITVHVGLYKDQHHGSAAHKTVGLPIKYIRLMPDSFAKIQPDYIPEALRADYREACLICHLSPKAAATLARRCLQGMIRDFCGIKGRRLIDEINNLRKAVEEGSAPRDVSMDSIDAIDNVRKVGNIGAHMEADIDLIVSVEPDETKLLIELVESLFEEWYVARHKRQIRFAAIAQMTEGKQRFISESKESKVLPAPTEEGTDIQPKT